MNAEQQEHYLNDHIDCLRRMDLEMPPRLGNDRNDCQFRSPYKLLVVFARK